MIRTPIPLTNAYMLSAYSANVSAGMKQKLKNIVNTTNINKISDRFKSNRFKVWNGFGAKIWTSSKDKWSDSNILAISNGNYFQIFEDYFIISRNSIRFCQWIDFKMNWSESLLNTDCTNYGILWIWITNVLGVDIINLGRINYIDVVCW